MSFKNSSQPIAKFLTKWGNTARSWETARCVISAARKNQNITVEDLESEIGKKRQFKVSYYPMQCDVASDTDDTVCSGSRVRIQPKQKIYELKRVTKSKVYELNAADIRLTDDGGLSFTDHARMQIASQLPAMRKRLSQEMLALLIANSGLQPNGTTSRRLSFSNSTNGAVNPKGKWEIERIFEDTGFNDPFILGGVEVDTWKKAVGIGTGNQHGQNIGGLNNLNMYYDALVSDTYGDGGEHIIAFDPTVFKFVSWSKYRGMFATDIKSITKDELDTLFKRASDSEIRGSFIDPVYGLMWDIRIVWDKCGGDDEEGAWVFQYSLNWDIFFMPEQNCNIQGVNGIFHFTTCTPVQIACPEGEEIPGLGSAKTYTWTPGDIFPLYISSMDIAGNATMPNVNVTDVDTLLAAMNDNSNGVVFSKNGIDITYSGYSGITGNINGTITITFQSDESSS